MILKLIKNTKGDSTLLFLLFLIVISVMFLHATGTISHNVALRSHMVRISEEIAMNIASAGMNMVAASEGRTEIDQTAADQIAREVLERESAADAIHSISLNNSAVRVEINFNGIRAVSTVQTLNLQ